MHLTLILRYCIISVTDLEIARDINNIQESFRCRYVVLGFAANLRNI